MKNRIFIFLILLFVLSLQIKTQGQEPISTPSYLAQIQKTAETMEVFPIDLIAREGPLSLYKTRSTRPDIGLRLELNREAFQQFYEFCQLAFDATPEDIDACIEYLPSATPKEKALILTVFYIYAYPWEKLWEKHPPVIQTDLPYCKEWRPEIFFKTQSWLFFQYPTGVFDFTTREKFQTDHTKASKHLLPLIAQYINDAEIAFPSYEMPPIRDGSEELSNLKRESTIFLQSIKTKEGKFDDDFKRFFHILSRENVLDEARKKYPADSVSAVVSCCMYASYPRDTIGGVDLLGTLPFVGNTSQKPKTLGQIAQELLASWDIPSLTGVLTEEEIRAIPHLDRWNKKQNENFSESEVNISSSILTSTLSYLEKIQKTAEKMEVFPIDFIARKGPFSGKGTKIPIIVRRELNRETFQQFYEFCQLAFDATPEDIDACVEYLPNATAKEKALILTVFYIYVYPWEKYERFTTVAEYVDSFSGRSWLSLQVPTGAFDLTIREKFQFNHTEARKQLLPIMSRYLNNEEVAFSSYEMESLQEDSEEWNKNEREASAFLQTIKTKDGVIDDDFERYFHVLSRTDFLNKMSRQYPADQVSAVVSCYLYASYWKDLFIPCFAFTKGEPRIGNTSDVPKTLGQIALELLQSWNVPPASPASENADSL